MRIVFMGTPYFAAITLEGLCDAGRAPVLVVSQPDRPRGRGLALAPTAVRETAERRGLPLIQPDKLSAEAVALIADAKPDIICVAAYGKILRSNLLNLPRLGCINAHASLLPRHRGAAPINWAIIHGDEVTGVTIMRMDEGMDTGPTWLTRRIPINHDDTAATVTEKLAHLAGRLLADALERIESGEAVFTPQDDASATYAPPLEKSDGVIDWTRPAREIDALIRGVTPWPGAQTKLSGRILKILKAEPAFGVEGEPHVIMRADVEGIVVATGDGALRIIELQLEGKKALPVGVFLRGTPLSTGDRLGN